MGECAPRHAACQRRRRPAIGWQATVLGAGLISLVTLPLAILPLIASEICVAPPAV
jgi:hypothetical protein